MIKDFQMITVMKYKGAGSRSDLRSHQEFTGQAWSLFAIAETCSFHESQK
jgi:hypothetical protein